MQFIHEIIGAYPKQSCADIIDFFDGHEHLARPGGAGDKELDNLEIPLDINFYNPNPNGFGLEHTLVNAIKELSAKVTALEAA